MGHSGATYEEAIEAIAAGAHQATHLFNRMPPYAGLSQAAANNNNNADVAQYSPIGRLLFVSANVKF